MSIINIFLINNEKKRQMHLALLEDEKTAVDMMM